MVVLLDMCPTRNRFVQALFGRSMTAWGRSVSVSTMLDFLEQPLESGIETNIAEQLPNHLRAMYATVFKCLAHRAGWPAVWPSFGWKERLPVPKLSNARRRLGGGRNESFHINEVGWLKDEASYSRVRTIASPFRCAFRLLDLKELPQLPPGRRIFFISNIDGSPQFLGSDSLDHLTASLGVPQDEGSKHAGDSSSNGTLLLSTLRAQ